MTSTRTAKRKVQVHTRHIIERWGEVPKAFMDLKLGMSATAEELIAFCLERLAHFKCPKAVAFGPLPKTSTGKMQKFKLREQEWAGREKKIN